MTVSNPLRVLIVEDEPLIAMDIQFMLEDIGHDPVAVAKSLQDAERLSPDLSPDLALVDIQLARDSCGLDVADLIRRQWPGAAIVFVTANPKKIPDDFCGAEGLIIKPFSETGFIAALGYIADTVANGGPTSPVPASFIPAPRVAPRD